MLVIDHSEDSDFKHIFPTTILKTKVDSNSFLTISKEIERSLQVQKSYVPSNQIGNSPYFSNGQETARKSPVSGNYISDYNLNTLGKCIAEQIKRYISKLYEIPESMLHQLSMNSWLADYRDGKTHLLAHQHERCFVNAVYYHQVNENKGGELVLYSPNAYLSYLSTTTHGKVFLKPESGMIIIFPSWMTHAVNAFSSDLDERRIAISVTCGFHE